MTALLFLSAFWFFLRGLAPGLVLGHAGDLLVSAATLGAGHGAAHPLVALLGRLAMLLPVGAPAFRVNLVSALGGAAAAVAAASMLRENGERISSAGFVAALAWCVARAPWWHAGAAGTMTIAIALGGGAVVAACRYAAAGRLQPLLLAALAAGLAWGAEASALVTLPVLIRAWVVAPGGDRRRAALLAAGWLLLPLGSLVLATALRGGHPAEHAGRLGSHLAGGPSAARWWLADLSIGRLGALVVQHALAAPWQDMGWLLAVAALGLALTSAESREARIAAALVIAGVVVAGLVFQDPTVERGGVAACWALAVAAGLGAAWSLRQLPAWGVGLGIAVLVGWQGWTVAGQTMRDRDLAAPDHAWNITATLSPGARVVAWDDAWVFPLGWERWQHAGGPFPEVVLSGEVSGTSAIRRNSSPDRVVIPDSPALYWKEARGAGVRPLLLAPEQPPLLLPSRGTRWEGLWQRVTTPAEPPAVAEGQPRRMARLKLRGLVHPLGIFEPMLVRTVALALHGQAQAALRAQRPADAAALTRIGMRLDDTLPELHEDLGQALLAQGVPGAGTWFTSALTLTKGRYLDPYLGLAALEKDQDMALEDLHTAAALGLGSQHPDLAAADEARLGGHREAARALYERGIAAGFVSRGMVYFQDGKLPQAAQAWETALAHDPRQAQACHNLGTLAALEERFDDAIRWYEQAKSLGPRSQELEDNLAKAREARAWLTRLPSLERALQASPRSPIAWCDLGNGYWYVGRSRPAEQCYRRALELDPEDVRAWGNLGSSLVHEGRVQEAISVYTQALKVRPDYAEAMVNLAAVYQVLGDYVRATDWAQRAAVLRPGDPQAARILRELAANH